MKRIPSLISILLFMAVLVVPSLVWGIRKISGNLPEDHMIETEENREPAEWPKKFSSNLPSEIEAYYNDRVPFRSFMVRAYSVVDGNTEGFYRKNLQPVLIAMSGRKGDIEVSGLTDLYNDKEVLTQNADSEKPKEIKPKSDQYVEVDRKDPSCGDAGYVTYAKKDGSDEYTEEIPALGHDYADAGVLNRRI